MTDFERICDLSSLINAAYKCREESGWKASVQQFMSSLLKNVVKLREELLEGTYEQKEFSEFLLSERGHVREIKALHIRDRVVQASLCQNVLIPRLRPYLTYDNGASLEGKGIDFTRRRIKIHLRQFYEQYNTNDGYILLVDFKQFFASIPHDKLIEELEKKLDDVQVVDLVKYIINSFPGDRGLGIGSPVSQICGVFYPTTIDNYCKIVKGFKWYGRYMDDIYVIAKTKEELIQLLGELKEIATKLGLTINDRKSRIVNLKYSFSFLQMKYQLRDDGKITVLSKETTVDREIHKLKKYKCKLNINKMKFEDIETNFRSWICSFESKLTYSQINKIVKTFNNIFDFDIRNQTLTLFKEGNYHDKNGVRRKRPGNPKSDFDFTEFSIYHRRLEDCQVLRSSSGRRRSPLRHVRSSCTTSSY